MERKLIRSGEIYHLIGFYGMINGEGFSRKEYLEARVELENNGSYTIKYPFYSGFIHSIAFNQDINAKSNPFCNNEIRIPFGYWNEIGKPLQIEKVKEISERIIFLKPESSLEVRAS